MSIDNKDLEKVMSKLEQMEDEELAVKLLAELNECTANWGKLIRNIDPNLSHTEWKNKCDRAQNAVEMVIKKINQQG